MHFLLGDVYFEVALPIDCWRLCRDWRCVGMPSGVMQLDFDALLNELVC